MNCKQALAITAASSCLLFTSATLASSHAANKGTTVRLLTVFQSQNATLKHIKGNQYKFSFPISKNSKVLVFSDRPNRVAFTMPRNKWAKMVMSGSNSFKKDPPNIVITWADAKITPAAYTIRGFVKTQRGAAYMLERVRMGSGNDVKTISGGVSVFVDAVGCIYHYGVLYYGNSNCKSKDS